MEKKTIEYDSQSYFYANIEFGNTDNLKLITCPKYIVDSGCSHTHAPFSQYI